MNETQHGHHSHGDPNGGGIRHDRPYWTRAHRDWRVWIGVVLMLLAMLIYLMTGDLAWRPHIQPPQAVSSPIGK